MPDRIEDVLPFFLQGKMPLETTLDFKVVSHRTIIVDYFQLGRIFLTNQPFEKYSIQA